MIQTNNYGAQPGEWRHFHSLVGNELLPVVSNPSAVISSASSLKSLGKTPSRYNEQGEVVGIGRWTELVITDAKIERWSKEPDYGICVRCSAVRAIDIDIDHELAMDIEEFIRDQTDEYIDCDLAIRRRQSSHRSLIAFRVEGSQPKRILKVSKEVDGVLVEGAIEFLGDGQQFIACGTHSSGEKYTWDWVLPDEIPLLTAEQFDQLWSDLADAFGCDEIVTEVSQRKRGLTVLTPDPVVDHLQREGLVLSANQDGSLVIKCPWDAEHSSDTVGTTATVWFRAGSNGYAHGHFDCRHAHCAHRSDDQFLEAIGFRDVEVESSFEVVEMSEEDQALDDELKQLLKKLTRNRDGKFTGDGHNVYLALGSAPFCGYHIGYDLFLDSVMLSAYGSTSGWRCLADNDYVHFNNQLIKRGFPDIATSKLREVTNAVALERSFDSAKDWARALRWDGVSRVDQFMHKYLGTADTPYTRELGRYMWSALAGRVLSPGIKADIIPVLIGRQGARKSTAIQALCPVPEAFLEVNLSERDTDLSRLMRGKLVGEVAELRGLRGKEAEHVKAFITRTHEEYVKKYQESRHSFPRRLIFIGSTNEQEFLTDSTGNRRWAPVEVAVESGIDIDLLRMDRDQLWAEGVVLFEGEGILAFELEDLAKSVVDVHMMEDSWQESIEQWLAIHGDEPFLCHDILTDSPFHFDVSQITHAHTIRTGSILRRLGYVNKVCRVRGQAGTKKRWVKG